MMDVWWDTWAAVCREYVPEYDLGSAVIRDGRTAVICWMDNGVLQVVLDHPLVEALVAQDAGFLLVPWLRRALRQFGRTGRVVALPMPRPWRRVRRTWIRQTARTTAVRFSR